jgi:outer membrane lipoprotein-sorting protein
MKCEKVNLVFVVCVAVILGGDATTVAFSSAAADDNLLPTEIINKAQENYASLTSYSDEEQIVATTDGTTTITIFTIRLARTNFYWFKTS